VDAELKALQAILQKALKDNVPETEIRKIHNSIITSFAARAYAVRRITTNKGKKTPGFDNILYTTDEQKYQAVEDLGSFNSSKYRASPVRRV